MAQHKKDQIAVFIPKTQKWYFLLDNMSWNTDPNRQFSLNGGNKDDIPAPGNYFGDGWRFATWRGGKFFVKGQGRNDWSTSTGNAEIIWTPGGKDKDDIPVPGNYVGDGITRFATFRPAEGNWYIKGQGLHDWTNTHQGNLVIQAGAKGDIPVPADYFGKGKTDVALFRPGSKNCSWFIKGEGLADWGASKDNKAVEFGKEGDIPVPADYTGSGRAELAVFRPKEGKWLIKGPGFDNWDKSSGNVELSFGKKGDIPIPGDFYGEGKARLAVYRPEDGRIIIKGLGFADESKSQGNLSLTIPEANGIPVVRKWDFH